MPPPDGLQEALASVIKLEGPKGSANHAVPRDLPASVRRCLDVLSAREGLPKRLATVPVESPDALIEQHAKTMAGKCKRCSELLRSRIKTTLVPTSCGKLIAISKPPIPTWS